MKPSESGKKDLFGTVQGSADAALLYAKHIDRSVSQMTVGDIAVRDLAEVFIGKDLRELCPDSAECENDGPCELYSCKFARFIFENLLMIVHDDFDEELSSFLKMYVRRLYAQVRFLVDYQIRNTEKITQPDEKTRTMMSEPLA
jgi:hypothetical protein